MYILILITSLKAQFHHQIELRSIEGLKSETQCLALGRKLSAELRQINPDVDVKSFCEEGK
jgi:hypothetical protein